MQAGDKMNEMISPVEIRYLEMDKYPVIPHSLTNAVWMELGTAKEFAESDKIILCQWFRKDIR